mmetsp:Transcript_70689/g.133415  ORF Transcript_70689/g.133415 Transcript_70689/m.133415 type:complete len:916 (+) Transcript_70689:77-2824(+)
MTAEEEEVEEQLQDDDALIAEMEAQAAAAMDEDEDGEAAAAAPSQEAPPAASPAPVPSPGDNGEAEPSTAAAAEAPKEPPAPVVEVEPEQDDVPADAKAARVKHTVGLSSSDSTLDVFFSEQNMVSSLSQGGFRHLLSGVRCNTGAKTGRYLFEVKVLESIPKAKTVLRIGFSLAKSSLFLGDGSPSNAFFDAEGSYHAPKPGSAGVVRSACKKLDKKVIGILLNLDTGSSCANTISIFLNGVRAGKPQPIPAHLKGKALYPTLAFQNVTLAVNFGHQQRMLKALPFKCTMFGSMLQAHSEQASFERPKDGKFQVVVPVGLPEEGFFDFVDRFVDAHPGFEELSDRRLVEWCLKSGLTRQEAPRPTHSVDRPDFNFGPMHIDNRSVRPMLKTLAQIANRDYIVADLRSNLLAVEREHLLSLFPPSTQRSAIVAIGEPSASFKKWVHEKIRSDYLEKKAAVEKQQAIVEAAGEDFAATVPASSLKLPPEPVINDSVWRLPVLEGVPDLSEKALSLTYDKFSLPSETEGFSKVDYEWLGKEAASEHLKKFILQRKATTILEGLVPGTWFKEKLKAWHTMRSELRKKHQEYSMKKAKNGGTDDDVGMFDIKGIKLENIHDIDSKGTPLYATFKYEDWILLSWRLELHILTHSFMLDVDDPDRPGIPEAHWTHYYKIYFGRDGDLVGQLNAGSLDKALKTLRGPVELQEKGGMKVLQSKLDKETSIEEFIKGVESYRRDRQRRIDAGDESAQLKFNKAPAKAKPAKAPSAPAKAAPKKAVPPGKAGGPPAKVASTAKAAPAAGGGVKRPTPPSAPPVRAEAAEPALKKPRVEGAPGAPTKVVHQTSAGKVVVTKAPIAKTPVAKAPIAKVAVAKTPITKAPITKAPITKAPITKAPIAKTPVTKSPGIAKAPIVKRPPT